MVIEKTIHFKRINHMKNISLSILILGLLLPLNAQAQKTSFEQQSPAWWENLEQQLAHSLNSSISEIQDETLQHIIYFASNYKAQANFDDATPKLLDIYENDPNPARRTMALIALDAIGNEATMIRLAELVENEPAGKIRSITLAVLVGYYKG